MPRRGTVRVKEPRKAQNEAGNGSATPSKEERDKDNSHNNLIQQGKGLEPYLTGKSVVRYCENLQRGDPLYKYKCAAKQSLINYIKKFKIAKLEAPFDRRVTFIEWHPSNPKLLAVASKSGDIYLWNYDGSIYDALKVRGIGAGGSIQEMKFDANDPHKIYTVSLEGKLLSVDFQTNMTGHILETMDFKRWYVTLDINWSVKTMVVGDNNGMLTILTTDGHIIDRVQVHKHNNRVTHVEFSKRNPWYFCTSSIDRTIKFWDIRNIKKNNYNNMADSQQTIKHVKPLSAAYFSLTDGSRLLTTDQFDKIHVYRAPLWKLETEIRHPHRQFQHLTPIRAYWHPFDDIILVGRYPHAQFPDYSPNERRSIDFFDAASGELLLKHYEQGFNGIPAINKFNCTGDALASGSGTRVLIWKPKFDPSCSNDLKSDKLRLKKY